MEGTRKGIREDPAARSLYRTRTGSPNDISSTSTLSTASLSAISACASKTRSTKRCRYSSEIVIRVLKYMGSPIGSARQQVAISHTDFEIAQTFKIRVRLPVFRVFRESFDCNDRAAAANPSSRLRILATRAAGPDRDLRSRPRLWHSKVVRLWQQEESRQLSTRNCRNESGKTSPQPRNRNKGEDRCLHAVHWP